MSGSREEQRARALSAALSSRLKGFRKKGAWLRRTRRGDGELQVLQVLGVQVAQQRTAGRDARVHVSVGAGLLGLPGVPLDAERVRPRDCLWAERLEDQEIGDEVAEIADDVAVEAEAWFEAHGTVEQLLAPFEDRDPGQVRGWIGQVDAVVAAWAVRGEEERARALFEAKHAHLREVGRAEPEAMAAMARALGWAGDDEGW